MLLNKTEQKPTAAQEGMMIIKADIKKLDLRILKYKSYIARHPDKAHGYYCLGKLTLMVGGPKASESYFGKALSLEQNYVPAVIGMIEAYVCGGKFSDTVRFYDKYLCSINKKRIYKTRLIRAVSSLYNDGFPDMTPYGLLQRFMLGLRARRLASVLEKDPGNTLVSLILCIYFLHRNDSSSRATTVYNTCVCLDDLDDGLRWALVKVLSKKDRAVFQDTRIAHKFTDIPGADCPAEYLNMLIAAALADNNLKKANKMLDSLKDFEKALTPGNLWKYMSLCGENGVYDARVARCCRKLLKSGWMDSRLAQVLTMVKPLHPALFNGYEEKVLKLFGY